MRKWRNWPITLVCLLLAALGVLFVSDHAEPRYHGRTLSAWARIHRSPDVLQEQMEDAIRQIGTNSFPFVLRWLRYEPQAWRDKIEYKLPRWVRPTGLTHWISNDKGRDQAESALLILAILGSEAEPLAPELFHIANNTASPDAAYRALDALGNLGTNGIPQLLAILANPNHKYRARAAGVIGEVVASDSGARFVVPALIRCLSETDPILIMRVSEALAQAGEESVAIDTLKENLQSPDSLIRVAATNGLQAIAPELLRHSPPE